MPRKKLDIAYFNARADEFDLVTDKNRNEVMKVVAELAVYIKRQVKLVERNYPYSFRQALKECTIDSRLFFCQLFWREGEMKNLPKLENNLGKLNRFFYGDMTAEIYAEYQKLFQKA